MILIQEALYKRVKLNGKVDNEDGVLLKGTPKFHANMEIYINDDLYRFIKVISEVNIDDTLEEE